MVPGVEADISCPVLARTSICRILRVNESLLSKEALITINPPPHLSTLSHFSLHSLRGRDCSFDPLPANGLSFCSDRTESDLEISSRGSDHAIFHGKSSSRLLGRHSGYAIPVLTRLVQAGLSAAAIATS
jgi:hypothetical protein